MSKTKENIIRKIAKKNIKKNGNQNIFLLIAIFITTFMISTIISLCINQIEQQRLFGLKQGVTDNQIEAIIYVLIIIAILVVIAGFFMINNVMSISVSRDIRLYGLLKAVGMTKKQIKRVLFKQIGNICLFSIPLGLLAGILTTKLFVPLFLRMYSGYGIQEYTIIFHPMAFLGAAAMAFLTAFIGACKPVKTAAQLSTIEVLKFSEYGYFHKIKTTKYSPVKAAIRNIVRVPRRAIKVFFGLFIGVTAFLTVSVILKSANIDMFMKQTSIYSEDSIYLRNGSADIAGDEKVDVFSQTFIDDLEAVPGLMEMRLSYFQKIQMEVKDRDGEIQNRPGYIYGINVNGIMELCKELDTAIDIEAFLRGEFVIVRNLNRGSYIHNSQVDFLVGNKDVSYPVGSFLPAEFDDYYGKSYNWLPCIFISEEALKDINNASQIYEIELIIEKEEHEQALNVVRNLCTNNQKIVMYSNIETRLEAETILSTLNIIGKSIAVMLCIMGILNFICVIITEILARQYEFALLESIGESTKQIESELMIEGAIYAIITFLLTGTLGAIMIYGLFYEMGKQFEYMKFTFPVISVSIMMFIICFLCIIVPKIVYRNICKCTIVDRLKKIE